jgi:hypothetical protein
MNQMQPLTYFVSLPENAVDAINNLFTDLSQLALAKKVYHQHLGVE